MFSAAIYLKCFACRFIKDSSLLYNAKINHNIHNNVIFIHEKIACGHLLSVLKQIGKRDVCLVASLIVLDIVRREEADIG